MSGSTCAQIRRRLHGLHLTHASTEMLAPSYADACKYRDSCAHVQRRGAQMHEDKERWCTHACEYRDAHTDTETRVRACTQIQRFSCVHTRKYRDAHARMHTATETRMHAGKYRDAVRACTHARRYRDVHACTQIQRRARMHADTETVVRWC